MDLALCKSNLKRKNRKKIKNDHPEWPQPEQLSNRSPLGAGLTAGFSISQMSQRTDFPSRSRCSVLSALGLDKMTALEPVP
jgi:hypothetical protein